MSIATQLSGNNVIEFRLAEVAAGTPFNALFSQYTDPNEDLNITIIGMTVTPRAAITGDNTNYATIKLQKVAAGGATTTDITTLDMVTGVDGVAYTRFDVPLVDPLVNDENIVKFDDVLVLDISHTGTGLLIPGSLVQVIYHVGGVPTV